MKLRCFGRVSGRKTEPVPLARESCFDCHPSLLSGSYHAFNQVSTHRYPVSSSVPGDHEGQEQMEHCGACRLPRQFLLGDYFEEGRLMERVTRRFVGT